MSSLARLGFLVLPIFLAFIANTTNFSLDFKLNYSKPSTIHKINEAVRNNLKSSNVKDEENIGDFNIMKFKPDDRANAVKDIKKNVKNIMANLTKSKSKPENIVEKGDEANEVDLFDTETVPENNPDPPPVITKKRQPVKLNVKQGLTMNQVLGVYSLTDASDEQCKKHSQEFSESLRALEPWALKMFDASSKLQSGILFGNLYEFGAYKQCLEVSEFTDYGQIRGKHCTLKIVPDLWLIQKVLSYRNVSEKRWETVKGFVQNATLDWSVCIPESCGVDDILPHFSKQILSLTEGLDIKVTLEEKNCYTLDTQYRLTKTQIIILSSVLIYGLFIAGITIADIYTVDENEATTNIWIKVFSARGNSKQIFAKSKGAVVNMCIRGSPKSTNLIGRYLSEFTESVKSANLTPIEVDGDVFVFTSFERGHSDLDCVHGIRVMSTCYVIVGHRFLIMMFYPIINSLYIIDWILYYRSTAITGGTLCVDTFFMISGMLVSLGYFKQAEKGPINWLLFYIYRYIRITVPLAVAVMFHAIFTEYFGSGPLWNDMIEVIENPCREYWWAVLLHIQNYVHPFPLCMTQTWYLTCDMQYYFLSPIILVPLGKHEGFGYANYGLIYALSVAVSFYLAWTNQYNGGVPVTNQLFSTKFFQRFYITPHTRVSTYLIGLLFGYVVHKTSGHRTKISNILAVAGWMICAATMLASLVGCHVFFQEEHNYNRVESSIFLSISRSTWTLGIVWMVWACINGYGGPINFVLSLNIFRVIGRVSYGMYLLHMVMQFIMSGALQVPLFFSDWNGVFFAVADLFIIAVIGYVFTLMFESPVAQILSIALKSASSQQKVQPASKEEIGVNGYKKY